MSTKSSDLPSLFCNRAPLGRRSSRVWSALPLLAVAACGGSVSGGAPGAATAFDTPPASDGQPASARPRWATPEHLAGRAAADEVVSIQVHLALRDQKAAEDELRDVSDPRSPRFGQHLTREAFAQKYAPAADDVAAVRAHLERHGLTVGYVPASRLFVTAKGTAAQVEEAFGTRLGRYRDGERVRRAPIDEPRLPASLAGRVSAVLGLAEPAQAKPHHVEKNAIGRARSKRPADDSGPATCSEGFGTALDTTDPPLDGYPSPLPYAPCGYTPAQIRNAYGFGDAVRAGNDGAGVTIAIVDAFGSPTLLQDAQTYAAQRDPDYPLDPSQLTILMAPGTDPPPPPDPGWAIESTLDVEAAHATAPGASLLFVGAASPSDADLVSAVNLVIDSGQATIVSNSYGFPEAAGGDFVAWQATITYAGLLGIGVYFSSGDDGDEVQSFGIPSAEFPASLPYVTAVGGTSLAIGPAGDRLFEVGWETGISELVVDPWSGVPAWTPSIFAFGSGGGASRIFPQPDYQADVVPDAMANGPGAPARVVPDVGMLGDPTTGMLLGMTGPDGQYTEGSIGGTSLACPLFAGVMALAEQNAGQPLGFANPRLYQAQSGLRDIAPDSPHAVALPGGGVAATFEMPGLTISTAPGYDDVTGLGVPDGQRFLDAMTGSASVDAMTGGASVDAKKK